VRRLPARHGQDAPRDRARYPRLPRRPARRLRDRDRMGRTARRRATPRPVRRGAAQALLDAVTDRRRGRLHPLLPAPRPRPRRPPTRPRPRNGPTNSLTPTARKPAEALSARDPGRDEPKSAPPAPISPPRHIPAAAREPPEGLSAPRRPPATGRWPLKQRSPFSTGETGVRFQPVLTQCKRLAVQRGDVARGEQMRKLGA
jgi:hypothetical protein